MVLNLRYSLAGSQTLVPMLSIPFLTDLDSRAAVKGSRDPLGIQPIWTRVGRHVVGNLTTVSNSARDFTTLLLGYYFAGIIAESWETGSELASFLKWEQLAAYSRAAANNDYNFRGTDRVRLNLSESHRVKLSANRAYQILGNQKIYGLWGLYTMPARSSGLVDGDPPRLTNAATQFVEKQYSSITRNNNTLRTIINILREPIANIDINGRHTSLIQSIGNALKRRFLSSEREFYRKHLLFGGPNDETSGRQRQLAHLLEATFDQSDFRWSTAMVGELAHRARDNGNEWQPLADFLFRIRTSESVLGPVSLLFSYLLDSDRQSLKSIAEQIRSAWGAGLRTVDVESFTQLRSELDDSDRWIGIATTATAGDYESLLELLIKQNAEVMYARGGTPWVVNDNGSLRVHFKGERGFLPKRDEIADIWRFPYFLDSLRQVGLTLKESNSDG